MQLEFFGRCYPPRYPERSLDRRALQKPLILLASAQGLERRFHLHFTPTSASWLNMVARFFAEITRKPHPP
jgi:hypothetical protein